MRCEVYLLNEAQCIENGYSFDPFRDDLPSNGKIADYRLWEKYPSEGETMEFDRIVYKVIHTITIRNGAGLIVQRAYVAPIHKIEE